MEWLYWNKNYEKMSVFVTLENDNRWAQISYSVMPRKHQENYQTSGIKNASCLFYYSDIGLPDTPMIWIKTHFLLYECHICFKLLAAK